MKIPLLPLLLAVASVTAAAQTYSLGSFTLDGGGGTSTGGIYAVSGALGQPDATVTLTGGAFAVTGGFWVLPGVVQTSGGPRLTVMPGAPGQAVLSWTPATAGFVLQESPGLQPPAWVNSESGAQNPVAVPAGQAARFYRVFKP
jgi:hypothetical protein